MHSQWVNEVRSAQRRRTGNIETAEEWDDIADPTPGIDPEYALMCKQIVASVEALPEAQRLVMMLVAVEGMSYREAANVLDIPIGTVMSRLARARLAIGEKFLTQGAQGLTARAGISKAST